MANLVFKHLQTSFQKMEIHRGSLSEMMLVGNPNLAVTCLTNRCANPSASSPVVHGMNCACFVSQSTTTRITLHSSDHGRLTTKSIEIDS